MTKDLGDRDLGLGARDLGVMTRDLGGIGTIYLVTYSIGRPGGAPFS